MKRFQEEAKALQAERVEDVKRFVNGTVETFYIRSGYLNAIAYDRCAGNAGLSDIPDRLCHTPDSCSETR
jgi:hypothetical protein